MSAVNITREIFFSTLTFKAWFIKILIHITREKNKKGAWVNKGQSLIFFMLLLPQTLIGTNSFLEERFTDIYRNGFWAFGNETVSGMGSSLYHTETIREELPKLFKRLGVHSVLDAACGDFNWMKHVVTDDITYIGADIVKPMIEENQKKYGSSNISFIHADITTDTLPKVDLIVSRDCLAHFTFRDAAKTIKNFKKSGAKYVLITTYHNGNRVNNDLVSRKIGYDNYVINLEKPPFHFSKPAEVVNEVCPYSSTPDKCLALWKLDELEIGSKSAITYLNSVDWGGRLGDSLLMYIKAKWIAYYYEIPFFYKPFKYSDQLVMHIEEKHWKDEYLQSYVFEEDICKKKNRYRDLTIDIDQYIEPHKNALYVINYYFHPSHWGRHPELYDSQEISMWRDMMADDIFREEVKQMIKPIKALNSFEIPKDKVTVAVHVRKGGGYDTPLLSMQLYEKVDLEGAFCHCQNDKDVYVDTAYPLKFPPDFFYVEQIKRLSEMYDDAPMYVHIFTDDKNPQLLVDRYEKAVNKPNIEFGCRKGDNQHDSNVLEDLFSLTKFDCLIRGGSNFPQIAELLGNYNIVIYPRSAQWQNVIFISEVGITKK